MKKATSIFLAFIILIFSINICAYGYDYVDYSAFDYVYENAKSLDKANYSTKSFEALKNLLNEYDNISTRNVDQAYVDRACSDLLTSLYDLKAYYNVVIISEYDFNIEIDNQSTPIKNTYSILHGSEVKLSAQAIDGYNFIGWFETTSKRYLSLDEDFCFIASSNINLKAIYSSNSSATLYFKNRSDQIIKAVEKPIDEWLTISDLSSLTPEVPYSFNKSNGSWSYDDEEILSQLISGKNASIYPKYEIDLGDDSKAPSNKTSEPKAILEFSYNKKEQMGSFLMHANIPEKCNLINVGIAFSYGKGKSFDPSKIILTLDNKNTISQFGNRLEDLYIVNAKTSGRSWASVGYITYLDEENNLKTNYTNQANIVENEWINPLKIESKGYYSNLELAIEDANNLSTENADSSQENAVASLFIKNHTAHIELLDDCEVNKSILLNSDTEIDLNNNTINIAPEKEIHFSNVLQIQNGGIIGSDSIQLLNGNSDSTLTLDKVNIEQEISDKIKSNSYLINTASKELEIKSSTLSLTGIGAKSLTAINLNVSNSNAVCNIADSSFYTNVTNGYSNGNIEAVGRINLYRNHCEIGRNRSNTSISSTASDVWFHDYCFSMNPSGSCQLYVDGGYYDSNFGTVYAPEHDIANVAFKLRPKAVAGSIATFEEKTAPLYVHGGNAGLSIQETEAYIYGGDFSSPDHGGIYSIASTEQPLKVYGGKFYTTTFQQDGLENVVRYGAFYCGGNNVVEITNAEIIGGKFGIRLKTATASKGSVTVQNSKVFGEQQAFSISQGTLTINKGTTTSWNTKYPETELAGGKLIDNR